MNYSSEKDWVWMGHAAHLCVGHQCLFHLATYINGYIISTVGEYKEPSINKTGFTEIGADRLYETMVFKAGPSKECPACPWVPANFEEIDMAGYNDADAATKGHYKMCQKYVKGKKVQKK